MSGQVTGWLDVQYTQTSSYTLPDCVVHLKHALPDAFEMVHNKMQSCQKEQYDVKVHRKQSAVRDPASMAIQRCSSLKTSFIVHVKGSIRCWSACWKWTIAFNTYRNRIKFAIHLIGWSPAIQGLDSPSLTTYFQSLGLCEKTMPNGSSNQSTPI